MNRTESQKTADSADSADVLKGIATDAGSLSVSSLLSAVLLLLFFVSACRSTPPRPSGPPPIPDNLAVHAQYPGRIVLTDNSPWQVQPAGQSASLRWRPGEPVAVVRSGHPAWPFILTNRRTHTVALARPFPRY